ncbi:16S rRNA (cytidine(1402)-2'-O)-methyltransferase [Sulfurospirillum sp. 1612]|uniref:16S rRNA (cytidine(1402)-2'-O)-methyltransferase n=1 Tax=Sulfurospirillum sp. 1612 TaxID=3094835 RepID=UPI002F95EF07
MVYLIPTPIGNIDDISLRSLALLSEIQILFCEDTRVTKKLLNLLSIKHNLEFKIDQYIAFHSHNDTKVLQEIDPDIFSKTVGFMSDAGMPCVSDPGAVLVQYCQEHQIDYEVLPGANAALLAYASSGFDMSQFLFHGFLPHKGNDRTQALSSVIDSIYPTILYESPHRIAKLSLELAKMCPDRKLFAIKEATKKFETKFFGLCCEFPEFSNTINAKGEWSLVLEPKAKQQGEPITEMDIQALDIPPKQKAKLLAKLTGMSIKACYKSVSKIDNL